MKFLQIITLSLALLALSCNAPQSEIEIVKQTPRVKISVLTLIEAADPTKTIEEWVNEAAGIAGYVEWEYYPPPVVLEGGPEPLHIAMVQAKIKADKRQKYKEGRVQFLYNLNTHAVKLSYCEMDGEIASPVQLGLL